MGNVASASGHIALHNNRGIDVTHAPYNAAGDGETDDSEAWTKAIADLDDGQVLFLPAGASFLLSEVGVTKPLTILGYGASIVGNENLRPSADRVNVLGVTFAGDRVLVDNTTDLHKRWLFRDCRFDGATLRLEKPGRTPLLEAGCGLASHVKVVDCEFWGYEGDYTLQIAGLDYVTVRGCDFHDLGVDVDEGDAIKVMNGAGRVLIDGCTIVNPTRDCVDAYDGGRVTIRGCTFIDAGAAAVDAKWRTTDTTTTGYLIVEGNRAEGCAAGFNVDVHRGRIIGNTAEGCGYGFRASQSIDDAPYEATAHVAFVGNGAFDNDTYGFGFANGSGFSLVGNHAVGNGTYGFSKGASVTVEAAANVAADNTSGGFNGFT